MTYLHILHYSFLNFAWIWFDQIGKGKVLVEGKDVALLGYGAMVQNCLKARALLSKLGIDVTVADARFCKPLDIKLVRELCQNHTFLITVEEGSIGGFGSHVSHFIALDGLLDSGVKVRVAFASCLFLFFDGKVCQLLVVSLFTVAALFFICKECSEKFSSYFFYVNFLVFKGISVHEFLITCLINFPVETNCFTRQLYWTCITNPTACSCGTHWTSHCCYSIKFARAYPWSPPFNVLETTEFSFWHLSFPDW